MFLWLSRMLVCFSSLLRCLISWWLNIWNNVSWVFSFSENCLFSLCVIWYSMYGLKGRFFMLNVGLVVRMLKCWFSSCSVLVDCWVLCWVMLVSMILWLMLVLVIRVRVLVDIGVVVVIG